MYTENHAIVAWFKKGFADAQKTNKKSAQNVLVSKAPLFNHPKTRSARLRGPRWELSAKLTEGLFCVDYRFLQSLRHGKPCHLPLHKGGSRKSCFWATDDGAYCAPYDLGRPVVAPTDKIEILTLTTDQAKISMSLFTIKTKRNTRWVVRPRVSTSLLN